MRKERALAKVGHAELVGYGLGWVASHCFRLGSCRERSSMQPSMCSMACLSAISEAATLWAAKNCFTSSRALAEQKLLVEPTNIAPISVVNWACTCGQWPSMYFQARSRVPSICKAMANWTAAS